MIRIFIFILCILSFTPLSHAADSEAESQTYDPSYTGQRNEAADKIREMQKQSQVEKGFIKPTTVQISLVHYPYMEEDQFGLQMSVPDMVSGCYNFSPLEYEAKFVEPYYLDIRVKQYRRIAPEGVNAAAKCTQNNKMSTALMVLDKKDLQGRGTQKIRFSADAGADTYEINLSDERLELIPESMVVFKAANLAGPLKDRLIHAFSSSSLVTLQVPMANPGEDLTPYVVNFAQTMGLSPAPGENLVSWGGNGYATYYFYDKGGNTLSRIGPDGYAEIGVISVNRPYDGPQGRTKTAVDLSVFATRPGTQL